MRGALFSSNPGKVDVFISHKEFLKSFCKSQFPRKFVNLFFILGIVKDKLTDLLGSSILQND